MNQRFTRAPRSAIAPIALLFLVLAMLPVFALDVPEMSGPVNDLAGVMSASEKTELATYLTDVSNQTGVQVSVLTVKSLEGNSIEGYSMKVAEKWKLGSADKNNGALLVVSIEERALRIEAGYGLEAELTDIKSGLIIRQVIVPSFKEGKYGEGIIAGAKNIVAVATGNASIAASGTSASATGDTESAGAGLVAIVFFIIMFVFLLAGLASRHSRRTGGAGGFLGAFLLGSALSDMNRHNRHDGFGGFSGGSGGGFGGGGGFSGGGGGFGGGGASGGW